MEELTKHASVIMLPDTMMTETEIVFSTTVLRVYNRMVKYVGEPQLEVLFLLDVSNRQHQTRNVNVLLLINGSLILLLMETASVRRPRLTGGL